MTLGAAANPLLAPVRHMVAFLLDTARALARPALTAGRREPPHGLGFTDRAVSRRIAALQAAPPPLLWPLAATVLALGALTVLGAADANGNLLRLVEPGLA